MKYADTPARKKVGDCSFSCPNCGKEHHRTVWQEQDEPDGGLIHADAVCPCGARLLAADNYQNFSVYWLNEKQIEGEKEEGSP